ncbi:MAG: NUDIX domain-containing protein [Patescibacteria group bacterium]
MELQVGVKILLQNEQGKYLLIHRSATKYPEVNNPWDIVGGRINPGTPLLENLKREIKEETALEIINEPKLVGAQDILRLPERHIVRLTYVGKTSGEPILDTEENDQYKWVTFDELRTTERLDKYVKELVDKGLLGS